MIRRVSWPTGLLLLAWLALSFTLLASGDRPGTWDWDHHLALAEVERSTVLEYGEFPLWNPYAAGGGPVLQHPLSSSLSPDFVLVLLLGIPFGLKALLVLRLAAGLAGAYLLAARVGLERPAAALASLVTNLSGAWAVHLAVGHLEWSLAGYLPWITLALLLAFEKRSPVWAVGAALGLAIVYLAGGIYLLIGFGVFALPWALVVALQKRSLQPLGLALLAALLAVGLAAVKLLPSWELMRQLPRETPPMVGLRAAEESAGVWEPVLGFGRVWLGHSRITAPDDVIRNHGSFWRASGEHRITREQVMRRNGFVEEINFHGYIGWIPLLLAGIGACLGGRRGLPWVSGFAPLLLLILSDSFARGWGVDPWEALRQLPVLQSLRTSGRFLVVAALPLGLLAGLGLEVLLQRFHWSTRFQGDAALAGRVLRGALPPIVALTLVWNALSFLQVAFHDRALVPPPIRSSFSTQLDPLDGSDWQTVRAGISALRAHSNLKLPSGALPREAPGYQGEVFLVGHGPIESFHIRPNRIEVNIARDLERETLLVINQTWAAAWRNEGGGSVVDSGGRLAVPVRPGERQVVLTYRPHMLRAGLVLSLFFWSVAAALVWRAGRPKALTE